MSSQYGRSSKLELENRRAPSSQLEIRLSKKALRKPKPQLFEDRERAPEASSSFDGTSWLLLCVFIAQILFDYLRLTQGVEFSDGLFYDPNLLRIVLLTLMSAPAIALMIFHANISTKIFEGEILKLFSVVICAGTNFFTFHVLFVLFGGYAHVHANAIDYYCIRHAKGNEELCRQAKNQLTDLPEHYRKLVKKSAGFYGQVSGKNKNLDLAFVGLVRQLSSPQASTPQNQK